MNLLVVFVQFFKGKKTTTRILLHCRVARGVQIAVHPRSEPPGFQTDIYADLHLELFHVNPLLSCCCQTTSILHCIEASVSAGGSCYYGRVAAASAESLRAGGKYVRPHSDLPACHLRLGAPAWWEDRRINPALLRRTEVIYGHCIRVIYRTNAPGDIHPVYFLSVNTC